MSLSGGPTGPSTMTVTFGSWTYFFSLPSISRESCDGVLPSDHYPVVARIDYARQPADPHLARRPPPQL